MKTCLFIFIFYGAAMAQVATPHADCDECTEINTNITSFTLEVTKSSTTPCTYTATGRTQTSGPACSVLINGSSFYVQKTSLISRTISASQSKTFSTSGTFSVDSFHASNTSIGHSCKRCNRDLRNCETTTGTGGGTMGGNGLPECPDGPDGCPAPYLCKVIDDCLSPILVDLDGNNFHFGGPDHPVNFDLYGDGLPISMTWVNPNEHDAFLIMDNNSNGIVDDGSELFGEGTRLILQNGALAPNGFVGLAQYDAIDLGGNDDGYISEADSIWPNLAFWVDINADGACSPSEMVQMEDTLINRFEVIPKENVTIDEHGNILRWWAKAHREDHRKLKMVDVYFRRVR